MDSRTLLNWVAAGVLPPKHLEQALEVAQARPDRARTLVFLDRLLLIGALLSACSGVIFFFAYNWDALSRLQRFTLAQVLLALPLLVLLRYPLQHWIAQSGVFASALLLGALLALVGQTYQTGADTFELFLFWGLLLVPWAVLGRNLAVAGLIVLLLNVALVLACQTFTQLNPDLRFVLLLGMNLLFWLPVARLDWSGKRLLWHAANAVLISVLLIIATGWSLLAVFDSSVRIHPWLGHLVWLLLLALLLVLYAWRSFQRSLLVLLLLALLLRLSFWVISQAADANMFMVFFLQGTLVLLVALGGYAWLKPKEKSHE